MCGKFSAISQDTSLYICTRFAQVSTFSHCSAELCARASCQEQRSRILQGTYFRWYSEKAGATRAIYSGLALCRGGEFGFGPRKRVQFSCLQSHPRLPMTCRRDAGIFSINNARPKTAKTSSIGNPLSDSN